MPLGDGTGPAGLGPMTGRAAGYCTGYSVPGYINPIPGRGGGRGLGWSGRGGGRGFGNMYWATGLPGWARYNMGYPAWGGVVNPNIPYPYGTQAVTPEQEAKALKNQAKSMQDNLNAMNERIHELEQLAVEKDKPQK